MISGPRTESVRMTQLKLYLQLAVPLEMQRLSVLSSQELHTLATTAVPDITQHGDELEFGGRHCGRAAAHLARALACAALVNPGGITFAGLHWCADHSECRRAATCAST